MGEGFLMKQAIKNFTHLSMNVTLVEQKETVNNHIRKTLKVVVKASASGITPTEPPSRTVAS